MKRSEGFPRFWIFPGWLLGRTWPVILLLLYMAVPIPRAAAATPVTNAVWLMDAKVALQMFDCGNLLCGRIVWLALPRDAQGALASDQHNPDIALRRRPLCGLTVLWAPKGRRSLGRRLVLQSG